MSLLLSNLTFLYQKLIFKTNTMKNSVYLTSLVIIALSMVLIIEYPNSGRMQLIAGGSISLGFALNVAGFSLKIKK